MDAKIEKAYLRWRDAALEDPDLTRDLESVKGDEREIYDRFYRDLEFGTGGLRGVLGAGSNRMNIYTVRQATQGLADFLRERYEAPAVAIAHDSRIKSDLFARTAAQVLAANGISVWLYRELMPTPSLSYAVRHLGCQSGIVITASHNPAKYNGYKVYGPDGCQIQPEVASAVLARIEKTDIFDGVRSVSLEEGLRQGKIRWIDQEVIDSYLSRVAREQVNPGVCRRAGLKVVYTPLNGAGNRCVRRILQMVGVEDVTVVPEQELPDGNFPTCPYPNPEIPQALELGARLCEKTGADLLLATDPDCDRVGITVPQREGGIRLFTGNETGVLLLDYLARSRRANGTLPERPLAVTTVVTTPLTWEVAASYGVEVVSVLTGFRFIGNVLAELEEKGEENRYILGFEESYGYLSGSYVRDKDGVDGSMLICEMASWYKEQGKTLIDAIEEIYRRYGRYLDSQRSFTCEGASGMERMTRIMDGLRAAPPTRIGGKKVIARADYLQSVRTLEDGSQEAISLPKSNVLAFQMEGARVTVRPSGTEPKIKVYFSVKGRDLEHARQLQQELEQDMTAKMGF